MVPIICKISFGLALLVSEIIRVSLKTPWAFKREKKPGLNRVKQDLTSNVPLH